jgi:hypothetical protein
LRALIVPSKSREDEESHLSFVICHLRLDQQAIDWQMTNDK